MTTKLQRLDRFRRIQELEAEGVRSARAMAERLGVPLRTIQKDLAELDLAFQKMEAAKEFRLTLKRRQADEIDRQVAACRQRYKALEEEWERSKKDKESSRAREITANGSVRTETQADREGRLGDPSYQKLMLDNDKHIADLMDLYPPKEHRHKVGGEPDNQTALPEKVESMIEVADAVNTVLNAVFGPTGDGGADHPPVLPDGAGQPVDSPEAPPDAQVFSFT
jgi:hypothetical protein